VCADDPRCVRRDAANVPNSEPSNIFHNVLAGGHRSQRALGRCLELGQVGVCCLAVTAGVFMYLELQDQCVW
jgi:hypothetical protein